MLMDEIYRRAAGNGRLVPYIGLLRYIATRPLLTEGDVIYSFTGNINDRSWVDIPALKESDTKKVIKSLKKGGFIIKEGKCLRLTEKGVKTLLPSGY